MDEDNKLPFKRVELSLTKFNEVAIPHHLDLLRQHKANIIKHRDDGQWVRVRAEQAHARRVCAQLRALLEQLAALRRRVRAPDVPRFDARIERARDLTLRAVLDYLDSALASTAASEAETPVAAPAESAGLAGDVEAPEREREAMRGREAALRGWAELQDDVCALHEAWRAMGAAALETRAPLETSAARVAAAADDVRAARGHLAAAARMRAGLCGACGAAAGALVGGPLGLLLGAKAGLAAGLAAASLGYAGARRLAPSADGR